MKKIKIEKLENREYYLVYCPGWSESGYDVCEFQDGKLISMNGSPLDKKYIETIYTLPKQDF